MSSALEFALLRRRQGATVAEATAAADLCAKGSIAEETTAAAAALMQAPQAPDDAASSFAEDAHIGDSASLAGGGEEEGAELPPLHEMLALAEGDYRGPDLRVTEDAAVLRIRDMVRADSSLCTCAPGAAFSLVSEAFLTACGQVNAKIATHLMSLGADINVINPDNNWTPFFAALYEPSFQSNLTLVKLLLNARNQKLDVWAVDKLQGWCALDYACEYLQLVLQLDSTAGFTGEDISDYRLYLEAFRGAPAGAPAPLPPKAWKAANPPEFEGTTPPGECLARARSVIACVAKHLACPPAIFEQCAPGGCRAAYDAHIAGEEAECSARAAAEAARAAAEAAEGARAAALVQRSEAARALHRAAEASAGHESTAAALLHSAAQAAAAAQAALAPLSSNAMPGSCSSDGGADMAQVKNAVLVASERASALAAAASSAAATAAATTSALLHLHHSAHATFAAHYTANTLVWLALAGLALAASVCGVRLWDIEARMY